MFTILTVATVVESGSVTIKVVTLVPGGAFSDTFNCCIFWTIITGGSSLASLVNIVMLECAVRLGKPKSEAVTDISLLIFCSKSRGVYSERCPVRGWMVKGEAVVEMLNRMSAFI